MAVNGVPPCPELCACSAMVGHAYSRSSLCLSNISLTTGKAGSAGSSIACYKPCCLAVDIRCTGVGMPWCGWHIKTGVCFIT